MFKVWDNRTENRAALVPVAKRMDRSDHKGLYYRCDTKLCCAYVTSAMAFDDRRRTLSISRSLKMLRQQVAEKTSIVLVIRDRARLTNTGHEHG